MSNMNEDENWDINSHDSNFNINTLTNPNDIPSNTDTTVKTNYTIIYNNQIKLKQKYESEILRYYKFSNTLLETLKSLQSFNDDIRKYSESGGIEFLIDFVERTLNWVSEHEVESKFYFHDAEDLRIFQHKNFNTHKNFVLELLLSMKEVAQRYSQSNDTDQQQTSEDNESNNEDTLVKERENQSWESLATLKTYFESLPKILGKISDIFENPEIKRLQGDDWSDKNRSQMDLRNQESEDSSSNNRNNYQPIQKQDSYNNPKYNSFSKQNTKDLDYLQNNESDDNKTPNKDVESQSNLKNEIIDGNPHDIFNNREQIQTLQSNKQQRLKALDGSIQSIKAKDLYTYQVTQTDSNNGNSSENNSQHTISIERLQDQVQNHNSLKKILHQLQKNPQLTNKIEAYEYKVNNKEQFEDHNIKMDDLIKLEISEPDDKSSNADYHTRNYNEIDKQAQLDQEFKSVMNNNFDDQRKNDQTIFSNQDTSNHNTRNQNKYVQSNTEHDHQLRNGNNIYKEYNTDTRNTDPNYKYPKTRETQVYYNNNSNTNLNVDTLTNNKKDNSIQKDTINQIKFADNWKTRIQNINTVAKPYKQVFPSKTVDISDQISPVSFREKNNYNKFNNSLQMGKSSISRTPKFINNPKLNESLNDFNKNANDQLNEYIKQNVQETEFDYFLKNSANSNKLNSRKYIKEIKTPSAQYQTMKSQDPKLPTDLKKKRQKQWNAQQLATKTFTRQNEND